MSDNKALNRIKVVLAEKGKSNKWLAEQLGKGDATISKWCTNRSQPSIETLVEIARVLKVDAKDLLQSTMEDSTMVYIKLQNNIEQLNNRTMEKNKQELLQKQANKIDEVIKVLTEQFGEDFADEVNYLEIVKGNLHTFTK